MSPPPPVVPPPASPPAAAPGPPPAAAPAVPSGAPAARADPAPGLRRVVRRLHRVLRDGDGDSGLVERFDEVTKLLCCRIWDEREPEGRRAFAPGAGGPGTARGPAAIAGDVRALFDRLCRARPALFPARFGRLALADATIARAAEVLAPVTLGGEGVDLKGLAYEEVIRDTFDKGDNGQFFTPRAVIELAVALLGGRLGGRVCDPACGTGGFLLGALAGPRAGPGGDARELVGFELDERLAWAARLNLELHGAARYRVEHLAGAGALAPDGPIGRELGSFDVVLTNPPFGSDLTDPGALAALALGRGRASRRRGVLFLERCLELLRPGGALAIVLDDGVLNSPSSADARRLLLERAAPLAIVSLPEATFLPYATVRTSLVVAERRAARSARRRPPPTAPCFFARAHEIGRRPNGEALARVSPATGRLEPDDDLPAIVEAWRARERAGAAPPASGRAEWFDAPLSDEPTVDPGCRLDVPYHHPARREAARALARSPHPVRALDELVVVRAEPRVPAIELADEEIAYLGLSGIDARTGRGLPAVVPAESVRSAALRFEPGDVLYARLRPELRKVCLAPGAGYASAECMVLVARRDAAGAPRLRPELLALLLRSDLAYGQVVHLVTGIGRPRLSRSSVLAIRLPVPPLEEQARLLAEHERAAGRAGALLADAERLAERARAAAAEATTDLLRALGPRHE